MEGHIMLLHVQINCSLAPVTAKTKGSVSHIATAASGWLTPNFSPCLRPLCSSNRRKNAVSHTSGSTKTSKGLKQAVGAWWMQVLTWQCKSGNWLCVLRGEICCQNNRSHGALSGWSENYFATCLVSVLASEVFYKMKWLFHKIKVPEYQHKLLLAQSLSLLSTKQMQSKGQTVSFVNKNELGDFKRTSTSPSNVSTWRYLTAICYTFYLKILLLSTVWLQ